MHENMHTHTHVTCVALLKKHWYGYLKNKIGNLPLRFKVLCEDQKPFIT